MDSLYQCRDYKEYLHLKVRENAKTRGYRTRLAEAASCQRAYLSQVLNSHVHLTPDQAAGIALFWQLSPGDTEYFLDLVSLARAGGRELRSHLTAKLKEARRKKQAVSSRLKGTVKPTSSRMAEYYSTWHLSAIHVLLSVPGFQSAPAISDRLRLSPKLVQENLSRLAEMGIIEQARDGKWKVIRHDFFLPSGSSPWIRSYHSSWRQKGIMELNVQEESDEEDLHYTHVYALSRQAVAEVREVILEAIRKAREIVAPSPEEEMVCLLIDLFRVD